MKILHFLPKSMTKVHLSFGKVLGVLLMLSFLIPAYEANASHFRYGSISWQKINNSTNQVQFKVSTAWRRWANQSVGQSVSVGTLYFGDGSYSYIYVTVTSAQGNSSTGWFYGEAIINHTYPNTTNNYLAYFNGCCRIGSLQGGAANGSWNVQTTVNIGNTNNSPVTTVSPIVNVQTGLSAATFNVPVTDPDGDNIKFRLATSAELGGISNPSGVSVNSSTGQVTMNTVGRSVGSLWAVGIVGEDLDANGNVKSKVLADFIVQIVQQSNPPYFYGLTPSNGTTYQVSPGQNVSFTIQAQDTDPGSTVTLNAIGAPIGSISTSLPTTSNPVSVGFNWTPTASNVGTSVINFTATDNNGVQVSTSVSVIVSMKPQFDIPPTPATGSHDIVVAPGTTIQYTVQASDPDPNDVVTINKVEGKDANGNHIALYSGASFSPLPTSTGNPTSGTFSWTPSAADWGHHHVFFTAEDSYGDKTVHEVYQLINTVPQFTSAPVTSVTAGVQYVYNVTVADPDQNYGDTVQIVATTQLPAWLTLVDNGNGTATLSGTPTIADAGNIAVSLQAQDINHHLNPGGIPQQNFVIEVIPCNITLSGTATDATCPGSADGSVQLNINGGAAPFNWGTSDPQTNLAAGTYNYTVTDANGCDASISLTVKDDDLTNPVAVTKDITVSLDANGQATISGNDVDNGSTDNCGIASLSVTPNSFNCSDVNKTVTAQSSYALDFDGANDYLITTSPITHGSNFTYEAWVYLRSSNDWDGIFTTLSPSNNHITQFTVNNSGRLRFEIKGAYGDNSRKIYDGSTYILNAWHHVAATFDGTNLLLYVDGQPETIAYKWDDDVVGTLSISKKFLMGTERNYGPDLDGKIDEIRMWNITKTASQIQSEMNMTLYGNESGLIGYWPIEEGTGSSTVDLVNGNNFSMHNMDPNTDWVTGNLNVLPQTGVEVTLTVTDNSGNSSTETAIVKVVDDTDPVAMCQSADIYLDASGFATIDVPASNTTLFFEDFTNDANGYYNNQSITNWNVTSDIDLANYVSGIAGKEIDLAGYTNSTIESSQSFNLTPGTYTFSFQHLSNTYNDNSVNVIIGTVFNQSFLSSTSSIKSESTTFTVTSAETATIKMVQLGTSDAGGSFIGQIKLEKQVPGHLAIENGSYDNCGIASISASQTNFSCTDVGANTVTLTVEDVHGNIGTCTSTVTVHDNIIPILVNMPTDITLTAQPNDCEPMVQWTEPNGVDNCSFTISSNYSSGDHFPVGTTNVEYTITDASGNQSMQSFTVTVNPTPVVLSYSTSDYNGNNISCYGLSDGSIDVSVSGGCLPYSYSWSNGSTSEDISSLNAGTYTLTVTDANNTSESISVTLTEPAQLSTSGVAYQYAGGWNVSCYGESDGSIDLSSTGGTTPYSYSWSTGATTEDVVNLATGSYQVSVSDQNGCQTSASFTISEPDELLSTISSATFVGGNNISCYGESDGSIDLNVTGGTSAYNYAWNTSASTEDINNLQAGTYSVTVTDQNGCQTSNNITLTEPAELVSTISSPTFTGGNHISCYGEDDGSIELSPTGGIGPYSFLWSNNASTEDLAQLEAGSYSVTISDQNGCVATNQITLTEPALLVADAGNDSSMCLNASKVLGGLNTGGIEPYSYSWSPVTNMTGSNTANPVVTPVVGVHTYTLNLSDVNGCTASDQVSVEVWELPVASLDTSSIESWCNGITLTAHSSTTENSYSWNNGESTQNIYLSLNRDTAGTYGVIVTDSNGCISLESADYSYDPEDNAGSYTLYAMNEVQLGHHHTVNNGSVGVRSIKGKAKFGHKTGVVGTGSFVKAKKIYKHSSTSLNAEIKSAAVIDLPERQYNSSFNSSFSWKKVKKGQSDSITSDYISVKVERGATAILTGSHFGEIKVEKGGKVVFYASDIEIKELEVEGSKPGYYFTYEEHEYKKGRKKYHYKKKVKVYMDYSRVVFMGDAVVKIAEELEIGKYSRVNPDYYKVLMYVGTEKPSYSKHGKSCKSKKYGYWGKYGKKSYSSKYYKGEAKISACCVEFNASIYMPEGDMHVYGSCGGKDDDDEGDDDKKKGKKSYGNNSCGTSFTGFYIANKIKATGSYVSWNWYDCDTFYSQPSMKYAVKDEITEIVSEGELYMEVYPNPAREQATIEFGVSQDGKATIELYDLMGKKLQVLYNGEVNTEESYKAEVNGSSLQSGVYLVRMVNGEEVITRRVIISK